ncbi:hypothetical protein DV737_g4796, partial [Chaetothyriales sp. CBS 132003]
MTARLVINSTEISDTMARNPGQLSDLSPLNVLVTGHTQDAKATLIEKRPAKWSRIDDGSMAFQVAYTTSEFPVSMNNDQDLAKSDALVASGKLGLVNPNGTVCRVVDFAPGFTCAMHRTQSLDYGVVVEGSVELVLEDGPPTIMNRGDIAVQRHTNHAWKNASSTEWARMVFMLQDSQPLTVEGSSLVDNAKSLFKPT